jgi:hypothetical protein
MRPAASPADRRADSLGSGGLFGSDLAARDPPAGRDIASRANEDRPSTEPGPRQPPGQVTDVLASPGMPLETGVRTTMEARLGHDLGRVRLHVDPTADLATRAVDALAWTVGSHVAFAAGRYSPNTVPGRELLAHELAHVVQQSADTRADSSGLLAVSHPKDPVETEASEFARPDTATGGVTAEGMAGRQDRIRVRPLAPLPFGVTRLLRESATGTSHGVPATGGGFPTAWQAAHAALARYNPMSILSKDPNNILSNGTEYGGLIYQSDGRYHFTEAVRGSSGDDASSGVDVWEALDKVPAHAQRSVVGDYHTHGAPPDPRRDPREIFKDPGEDFSGFHAAPGATSEQLARGDISETRSDLTTHRAQILDPRRYTAFLATPTGRFAIFIPAQNLVFSFSPDPRLLPRGARVPASAYAH